MLLSTVVKAICNKLFAPYQHLKVLLDNSFRKEIVLDLHNNLFFHTINVFSSFYWKTRYFVYHHIMTGY